jgi:GPI transamidase subunit PIG-U
MDYIIAISLTTVAGFKNETHASERWPEAEQVEDEGDDEDEDLNLGEVDEKLEELLKPRTAAKPYVDPNELNVHHWNDASKPMDTLVNPNDIGSLYLWNPYSILVCLGQSTQLFNSLFIMLSLAFAVKGKPIASVMFIALATYMSLYPIVLLAPCILILSRRLNSNVNQSNLDKCNYA